MLRPETGAGLDTLLRERGRRARRDPQRHRRRRLGSGCATLHIPAPFDAGDLAAKALSRAALSTRLDLPERAGPLAVAVTRLVEQKGIDLLLPLVPGLEELGLQVGILGSGDAALAEALRTAAAAASDLSRASSKATTRRSPTSLFAGGDLLLMPSRFEPCGLAQMQAMRYGTLPVVTDVGGLHDTVVDLDDDPDRGTGWRARAADASALQDALVRAVRGWADPAVRTPAQVRGMTADWSWAEPAARHVELYRRLADR